MRLSTVAAAALEAAAGDLIYLSDRRWWLGGLRSAHAVVGEVVDSGEPWLELGPETFASVVVPGRRDEPLCVDRLY